MRREILILYWWVPKTVQPLKKIIDQDLSKLYFAYLSLVSKAPPLEFILIFPTFKVTSE